jgi:hypothetical protein
MQGESDGERAVYSWLGRDAAGEIASPGMYLLRVDLGASTGEGVALRAIAVAY